MSKVLIACVGGFLGAGKTTALAGAAREFHTRGLKVGIITNDQGSHLVDTEVMRSLGMPTEEISGGCFCCRFDELIDHAEILSREHPDIILAEAVGSCTDLAATVYQPLRQYYADRFDLAPLSILVEPARLQLFSGDLSNPFPESVGYLFEKQLAEADLILLNKSDLITIGKRDALIASIQSRVGNQPVHSMSALTGWGVQAWVDLLLDSRTAGERVLELDYGTYAQAEASLGWLNATVEFTSSQEFSPGELGAVLIHRIRHGSLDRQAAIAHLKILVVTTEESDRIAITDNQGEAHWSGGGKFAPVSEANLIINARIRTDPEELKCMVESSILLAADELGVKSQVQHIESFSPLPPKPRYRLKVASRD